ncbi:hypothetical protein MST27_04770 [Pseudomonas sp. PS1]|uniref:Uncharacterized protein n=1 Tax=Stutzerimonas marianensis TaxID=2929513 RepID=A0A9X2AQT7_9GAMM|nr:hypothetical protein [Pseudomonas marianensis]MCJ0972678.1 hypothetical protein [Pseudomonas marianensis]
MKIVGGSFGLKGSAFFSRDKLCIEGSRKAEYGPEGVRAVAARSETEKKFGLIGCAVGALLLGGLGLFFLGLFGAILGIVFAVAGSFYSTKKNVADLTFEDGSTLTLECTGRAMDKLVRFTSK